ncbi:pimeloyl-ACP methyl ester carboxylesterase [Aquimarina sp. MAR_2010_214]|uniref:alpha/beta fold hydrolase n=1 Tax=Aquimarina sp. MAR_2010_214 TaxID=1250026 RepID=UPI000C6FD271|nr:alpha/beta fold hydrolase [Aquimarina sp. MAR_2010_214]PKV50143.1 pimeloyl-ACP methyl ester carboxylesterase [Aquimarina sp. MAR_2010_214]
MKTYNIIPTIIITLLSSILISSCAPKIPVFGKNKALKEGDITIRQGTFKNKNTKKHPKKIKADYFSLAVKENRNNPNSRIITIPVVKLHSISNSPKEPVFLLAGGPGASNIWKNPRLWLLDNHDIIMVGYRGVEGSVQLDSEAFEKTLINHSNVFSTEHLKKLGNVLKNELKQYKKKGIDINGYNMIEVIDDIELAKNRLGYDKINLFGASYGTRLAYIYGLRYPNSIHRSVIGGINPPGHFAWDPDEVDNVLNKYGELWKTKASNLKRSPDIIKTIQNVFSKLPVQWKKIHIDPGKVRVTMFSMLYTTVGTAQIFDAFIAAEKGDFSGLAFLVMMYDLLPDVKKIYWGEFLTKSITADYQLEKNYTAAMDSKSNLLGAPLSKLFEIINHSEWDVQMIPKQYRTFKTSYVTTLLVNGNLDVSSPIENAKELIDYLPNGHLVVITDSGHHDFYKKQEEVVNTMIKKFYLTGKVNDERIKHISADLGKPKQSLQKLGKSLYTLKKLGLLKIVVKLFM